MKSAVEKLNPTKVKLTVEVPFAELNPFIDQAAKKLATQVQIPGFRKGKVPARILEQRIGRPAILQEAVDLGLNTFYGEAVRENNIVPLLQPSVDITQVPGLAAADDADFVFSAEIEVRPEVTLPEFNKKFEIVVDTAVIGEDAVDVRLDALRERFGSLAIVERAAADRDFVTLDMTAKIGDELIDTVTGISYQIGEKNLLEGLDEALLGSSADEETTFKTKLAGGEHAGEEADVTVKTVSVKERTLPKADDDFAQLASEFDTIEELRASLQEIAEADAVRNQTIQARESLLAKLVEVMDVPISTVAVDEEVAEHLRNEGKEADDPHGAEVREGAETNFQQRIILDEIVQAADVPVSQEELTEFLATMAAQYGMELGQFIAAVEQSGQLPIMVGEVARNKAVISVLEQITIKDETGKVLDLGLMEEEDEEEAAEEASDKDAK